MMSQFKIILWLALLCFAQPLMAGQNATFPRVCLFDQVVKDNPLDFPITPDSDVAQNWGKPDYDQSRWPLVELDYLKETGTVCWVRTHVDIGDDLESYINKGFTVSKRF